MLAIVAGQVNCDEQTARAFLGMSPTMFDEYRARRIIRPLRKGLYCYQDLIDAVERIRADRDKIVNIEFNNENAQSTIRRKPRRKEPVGSEGNRGIRSTQDILGSHRERSGS